MLKLLVPVDGTEPALSAVRYAARLVQERPGAVIHLFNVQPPIAGTAPTFVGRKPIRLYYEEQGNAALAEARQILDAEAVPYEHHIAVGEPAEAIADYAAEHGFDQIVMTRRTGALARLLGSTATDVLEHARTPVTFVS
jgi:nucleotide-binding universal stress UspA family protein